MHVVIALFCSLLSMCYFASIFHVLTHFRATTYHVADFSDDELGALGRDLSLSDAVGVDGLTLSSKPSTVIIIRWP